MKQKSQALEDDSNQETSDSGQKTPKLAKEINGYEAEGLPEPTRYGDWEVKGRCSDF